MNTDLIPAFILSTLTSFGSKAKAQKTGTTTESYAMETIRFGLPSDVN